MQGNNIFIHNCSTKTLPIDKLELICTYKYVYVDIIKLLYI